MDINYILARAISDFEAYLEGGWSAEEARVKILASWLITEKQSQWIKREFY